MARIGTAAGSSYNVVGYEEVEVWRLFPHPDAVVPIDPVDQEAIERSVDENKILAPLLVSADMQRHPKGGEGRCIYDGVNRWRSADNLGMKTVPCLLVKTDDPKRVVYECLCAGRKRTTGTRILAYVERHKTAILDAREQGRRIANGGKLPKLSVSHGETPTTPNEIADRLKCSKQDVVNAIDLVEAIEKKKTLFDAGLGERPKRATEEYVKALREQHAQVMVGMTPIRRWKSAFNSRMSPRVKNQRQPGGGNTPAQRIALLCEKLEGELEKWGEYDQQTRRSVKDNLTNLIEYAQGLLGIG